MADRARLEELRRLRSQSAPSSARARLDELRAKKTGETPASSGGGFWGSAPVSVVAGLLDFPVGLAQSILKGPSYATESRGPDLGFNPDDFVDPRGAIADRASGALDSAIQGVNQRIDTARGDGFNLPRTAGRIAAALGGTRRIPIPTTLGGKVQQGAVLGSVFGGLTPTTTDDPNERMRNVLLEGSIGAAIPGGIAGAQGAATAVRGVYNAGRNTIGDILPGGLNRAKDRFVRELFGDDIPAVQRSLEGRVDPLMMGHQAASRSGSTEQAALGNLSRNRLPTPFLERLNAQRTRTSQDIDQIGGSTGQYAAAQRARSGNASSLYPLAEATPVSRNRQLKGILKDIQGFLPAAISHADDLAEVNKLPMTGGKQAAPASIDEWFASLEQPEVKKEIADEALTKYLQWIKFGIDKEIAKTGDLALSKVERDAARDLQTKLVGWLENQNAAYKEAIETYRADSIPVNRGAVGNSIRQALSSSTGPRGSVRTFDNAVKQALKDLKKQSGSKQTLAGVLTPEGLAASGRVRGTLDNDAIIKEMASSGGQRMNSLANEIGDVKSPGWFNRATTLIKNVMSEAGSVRKDEVLDMIAKANIEGPQALRAIIPDMTTSQAEQLHNFLKTSPQVQQLLRTAPPIMAQEGAN